MTCRETRLPATSPASSATACKVAQHASRQSGERTAPRRPTQGVPSLQHEALDDPVENDAIVVAIPGVSGPVLHSLWALVREELDMYVPSGTVNNGGAG